MISLSSDFESDASTIPPLLQNKSILAQFFKICKYLVKNKSCLIKFEVTVQVGSYSDMKLSQIFYFYLLFIR